MAQDKPATGDTRYGHRSGSGANEPKGHERKEQDPAWTSRQGGDQTAADPRDPTGTMARGKATRAPDEPRTREHREGSEQGPK